MNTVEAVADRHSLAIPDNGRNARTVLDLWLAGYRSENARRAYRREIETYATFTKHYVAAEAVSAFIALGDGPAHAIADAWRTAKLAKGLSPAAINRSMAALNSMVASARRHGFTTLRLEAKGKRSQSYRDTKRQDLTAFSSCSPRRASRNGARRQETKPLAGSPSDSDFAAVRSPR